MSRNMCTRRTLLATLPSVGLAPAAALGGPPAARVDPHPAWLAEWLQERDALDHTDMPQEAYDLRHDVWNDLGTMIEETRAETVNGIAAQIEYGLADSDGDLADRRDVRSALLENALASLRRLA